jgi:hypothetical protein
VGKKGVSIAVQLTEAYFRADKERGTDYKCSILSETIRFRELQYRSVVQQNLIEE